jgi:glycine C-acetyltransferase
MFGVQDRVDIISGTLGKALGGASGGYISAHREIVDLLRQRARPYLFSNAVAPAVVAGSLVALDLVREAGELRESLWRNARDFRERMEKAGFDLLPGEHAIIPVMFPDAHDAVAIADAMLERGVYVIAFSYPVVPMGKARIRVQISAAHSADDIAACVDAFTDARAAVGGQAAGEVL